MHEQRLTVRLIKYWNQVRKANRIPAIQQFNPAPVEDLWQNCFRVSVDPHRAGLYKYEYLGDAIIAIYGMDLTGMQVDARMKQFPGASLLKQLQESVTEEIPKEGDGFFVNQNGKLVKYRVCYLPFGSDVKGITHVIAGLSYRIF